MQDWNKLFIYKDGDLLDRATGKSNREIIHGHYQVSSSISTNFEGSNSSKVAIRYRCDKIIFEMHHNIEVYAPNLKHIDKNDLNDRIENLSLPELDTHPLDIPELKKMVSRGHLEYVPRFNSTVSNFYIGALAGRYMPLYSKYALGRKCVVRSNPKVEIKNLNWLMSGREIPRGYQVSQIDGDYRRCDVENLQLTLLGTPLPILEGVHKFWFVKNGKLFNRTAFNAAKMPNGKLWVYYDSSDSSLATYSCIIEEPTEPYDHSMRAIYPFMPSHVLIRNTLIAKEHLIDHLVNNSELQVAVLSPAEVTAVIKHSDQLYNKLVSGI